LLTKKHQNENKMEAMKLSAHKCR